MPRVGFCDLSKFTTHLPPDTEKARRSIGDDESGGPPDIGARPVETVAQDASLPPLGTVGRTLPLQSL